MKTMENIVEENGFHPLFWRDVPIRTDCLTKSAFRTLPVIRQLIIARKDVLREEIERQLYVLRRRVENDIAPRNDGSVPFFYIASMSSRTVVYKGMLSGSRIADFYPDLADHDCQSAFAIVHQRFLTTEEPTWNLAQPLRYVAHNGYFNSVGGNKNHMCVREPLLASSALGDDIDVIKPVIRPGGSDSAAFDNVLELLIHGGRSLPHAIMMMIPEAWGMKYFMGDDRRTFYEYHAAIMEPWDGPAVLVFTDGRFIGATLDRNGLRSARYTITRDGMIVLANEEGMVAYPGDEVRSHGRLQPGKMLLVDLEHHRVVPDNVIKATICRGKPYRRWVRDNRIELTGLIAPVSKPPESADYLLRMHHTFGYTEEELKMVAIPMIWGQEAVGSMGNDTPLAVLSKRPKLLYSYFKQSFAQIMCPPIDPLREELVMSLMNFIGPKRSLLEESPEHCRRLKLSHPILTDENMNRLRSSDHPDIRAVDIEILFPAEGDGASLENGS